MRGRRCDRTDSVGGRFNPRARRADPQSTHSFAHPRRYLDDGRRGRGRSAGHRDHTAGGYRPARGHGCRVAVHTGPGRADDSGSRTTDRGPLAGARGAHAGVAVDGAHTGRGTSCRSQRRTGRHLHGARQIGRTGTPAGGSATGAGRVRSGVGDQSRLAGARPRTGQLAVAAGRRGRQRPARCQRGGRHRDGHDRVGRQRSDEHPGGTSRRVGEPERTDSRPEPRGASRGRARGVAAGADGCGRRGPAHGGLVYGSATGAVADRLDQDSAAPAAADRLDQDSAASDPAVPGPVRPASEHHPGHRAPVLTVARVTHGAAEATSLA
ncbi:hypothetical protein MSMEI_1364 [Mycolicibacterium smegmatis MC2 155]|uniref:Uncharacterized protein n=1 Tax=Mycolicibacterium smegmatis (strain ATCC 700084 / mc(2)155) TaxID=246196 RepID=I7FY36_MYCS2|nr:hypothetical protein MSMEI_1364 [Mycolicibacterium smegmatis MC2 155]